MFARPSVVFLAASLLSAITASGQFLGSPTNVLFSSTNNAATAADSTVISPDGSWIATIATNNSIADVVVTEIDDDGTIIGQTNINFPNSINVSTANSGLVMAKNSKFCVCLGSGGVGDLVVIRRTASGGFDSVLVDYSAGSAPLIDTRPVIAPDGRYVCSLGAGTTSDLVFTPISYSVAGIPSPGTPINLSFPSSANIPTVTGVRPVVAPNSNSVAVVGTLTTGDIVVVTVPNPLTSGGLVATNIDYPSGNSIPTNSTPIVVAPDSTYYVTYGQSTTGDLVLTALSPSGVPQTPQNVLFPSSNNNLDTTVPTAIDGEGRILATNATLTAGDIVLCPVSTLGVAGTAVNVSYPSSNFVVSGSPQIKLAKSGRYAVGAGSSTIGDIVVTEIDYVYATNSLTATPRNVLFPNTNDIRTAATEIAVSNDGAFVATLGSNATVGDLVLVGVDTSGVPQTAVNVAYPFSMNVPSFFTEVVIDPGCDWVLTPGADTLGDVVLVPIERDVNCDLDTGTIEVNLFPSFNNISTTHSGPIAAPSGRFVVTPGSATIGDLVLTPIDDARVFVLDTPCLGQTIDLLFRSPADPFASYVAAISFGRCPGIALGDGRTVELVDDILFEMTPFNTGLFGFTGTFDPVGHAFAAIVLPVVPDARGQEIYCAFVVLDPGASLGIGTISAPCAILLR